MPEDPCSIAAAISALSGYNKYTLRQEPLLHVVEKKTSAAAHYYILCRPVPYFIDGEYTQITFKDAN